MVRGFMEFVTVQNQLQLKQEKETDVIQGQVLCGLHLMNHWQNLQDLKKKFMVIYPPSSAYLLFKKWYQ